MTTSDPMPAPARSDRSGEIVRLIIVLALGAAGGYLVGLMLLPFLGAIVTAAVIASLVYPAHRRLERRVRSRTAAALLSSVVLFVVILLPALWVSVAVANQILIGVDRLGHEIPGWLAAGGLLERMVGGIAARVGVDPAQVGALAGEQLRQLGALLVSRMVGFLSGIGGWLLQAGAALFTLYYLLRDGDALVRTLKWLVPLDAAATDQLLERAREVTYATVYGNVMVALAQGALGGLAFALLGLPGAVFWGTIMALLSLLPVIGPALVWAPAAGVLLMQGDVARGLIMVAFGALVIGTVDNLLRAIVVSGRSQLHPLVVFFSVLGGIFVFGAVGILVGPVIFVVALMLVEMARRALDPAGASATSPSILAQLTVPPDR